MATTCYLCAACPKTRRLESVHCDCSLITHVDAGPDNNPNPESTARTPVKPKAVRIAPLEDGLSRDYGLLSSAALSLPLSLHFSLSLEQEMSDLSGSCSASQCSTECLSGAVRTGCVLGEDIRKRGKRSIAMATCRRPPGVERGISQYPCPGRFRLRSVRLDP